MGILDKKGILKQIGNLKNIQLEIGCGSRKRKQESIGIDMLDYPDVDIVADVYDAIDLFPDQSVDAIYSYHFVEHVSDLSKLMSSFARIVKSGGHIEIVAPHFSNPYFYSDPTHRTFFGLYTFCYFANKSPLRRNVPTYGHDVKFSIDKIDLNFKSSRPFIFRYAIKRITGIFFNSTCFLKEFYEENLCYIFPCYEVRYILKRH